MNDSFKLSDDDSLEMLSYRKNDCYNFQFHHRMFWILMYHLIYYVAIPWYFWQRYNLFSLEHVKRKYEIIIFQLISCEIDFLCKSTVATKLGDRAAEFWKHDAEIL